MLKKIDSYIGSFFNRYKDFGSFIAVVSMLLSAMIGGVILLLSYMFFKYKPEGFLDSLFFYLNCGLYISH